LVGITIAAGVAAAPVEAPALPDAAAVAGTGVAGTAVGLGVALAELQADATIPATRAIPSH
jgi:hypothetical protein